MKYEASVNRTIKIKSLEDKARCNMLDWRKPKNFKSEILPEISPRTGKELGYNRHMDLIIVKDFDRDKEVVRSRFFNDDGSDRARKPIIGIEKGNPRYSNFVKSFYGHKSSNFVQKKLTIDEIVQTLKDGYSIAPGLHDPNRSDSGSHRSCTVSYTHLTLPTICSV